MAEGVMPNGENDVLRAKCQTSLGVMPNGPLGGMPKGRNTEKDQHWRFILCMIASLHFFLVCD